MIDMTYRVESFQSEYGYKVHVAFVRDAKDIFSTSTIIPAHCTDSAIDCIFRDMKHKFLKVLKARRKIEEAMRQMNMKKRIESWEK